MPRTSENKLDDENSSAASSETSGAALTRNIGEKIKEQEREEENSVAALISEISAKTGILPNKIREIYQNPEMGGRIDADSLERDFNGGKGSQKIQDKAKEFDEQNKMAEKEKTWVAKSGHEPRSPTKSFAELVTTGKNITDRSQG